jgi:glycosyltransferase involved in cell wall biosynthesis
MLENRNMFSKAILYGRQNGLAALVSLLRERVGPLRSLTTWGRTGNWSADRETVLVVSHEASRTGAPILALNLVQDLARRYNVVVLLLGGGPLYGDFRDAGASVIVASYLRLVPGLAGLAVGRLCGKFKFKFALVNSIESRVVLRPLKSNGVCTISLIHEFAAYTRPRDAFVQAASYSDELVFSTGVTLENALLEYPGLAERAVHTLPQGRCLVPSGGLTREEELAEATRIRKLVRPEGIPENAVVVVGAGSVILRKGVDKFIECAAQVVRAPGGGNCRFVWIGKGYDPDRDLRYSVYLEDQIRRSGLSGYLFFGEETPAIQLVYEQADLFLLSSRLDPLPNVAIDALAEGVPVLCFDKTTGIAEFLVESGLQDYCVAEYLDSSDMASKVLALADSQELRANVARRCRDASAAYFDMSHYVERLEYLCNEAYLRTKKQTKASFK